MARPPEFTDEVQAQFLALREARVPIESACEHVGISPTTVYRWLRFGHPEFDRATSKEDPPADLEPYRKFWQAHERAKDALRRSASILVRRKLARLAKSDEDLDRISLRELTALLKVVAPDDWGDQSRVIHSGDPERPVQVEAVGVTPEDIASVMGILDGAGAGEVVPITSAPSAKAKKVTAKRTPVTKAKPRVTTKAKPVTRPATKKRKA